MQRYKDAANDDTRKALYRYNLRLSQEMFTIVSCFEVALRNAIDSLLVPSLGDNWLKDSVQTNNHNFAPTYYKCSMLGQIVKYDMPMVGTGTFYRSITNDCMVRRSMLQSLLTSGSP